MQRQKKVRILFNTSVSENFPDRIMIDHNGNSQQISNDYLFVFAGALLPFDFLKSIGIMIDKKFGEAI